METMRKMTKRITALVLAVLLFAGMTGGVFAAGSIYPQTGTRIVYRPNSGSAYGTISVGLANGEKSFTMKRSDVKITKGGTGAKLSYFTKNYYISQYSDEYLSGTAWESNSDSYKSCSYRAELQVNHTGTATVKYKIGDESYALKVQVLGYKNPVKSITLTGVKSGKNFSSLTKKNLTMKTLPLKKTVSSAKLKVTSASGWKITQVQIYDIKTGQSRYDTCSDGLRSMTLSCGKLLNTHRYQVWVSFVNTANGATMTTSYLVAGAKS